MTKCKANDCVKDAVYNIKEQKQVKFCFIHKLPDMIDVKHKKCIEPGCNKTPGFNYPNNSVRLFCKFHKKDTMINVKNKDCIYETCKKQAVCNFTNEKQVLYCENHKELGMINIRRNLCIYNNCSTIAVFNFSNEIRGKYCGAHKLVNMVDIINKKCIEATCNNLPSFNYPDKHPDYCSSHTLPGMVDTRHSKFICSSCNLEWYKNKKDQSLCSYCNSTKRQKTKENEIKKLLEKHNIENIHDKTFKNNCCLRYRPDFIIYCKTFYLILEVDEFGHISYPEECEIVRMNNIGYALDKPVKFLRYNPDNKNFTKKNKEKVLLEEIQKIMNQEFLDNPSPKYLFYPTSS